MLSIYLSSLLIYLFGTFNLIGVRGSLLINQIIFCLLGIITFIAIKKITPQFFKINASIFYWAFVIILILTFIVGLEVKGSKRWIDLYFFNFQASEFLKIFFILYLAKFFTSQRLYIKQPKIFFQSVLYFLIPFFIIFKQPDLGSAMVYAFVFFIMLLFSDIPKKTIFSTLLIIVILLPLTWPLLKTYQQDRILSFFNPHIDQQGTSYNMTQALITIGSGNFTGRGLGLGPQSQLYFLPENHTDFAFSALIEQFGFVGGLVIIICYFVIFIALAKKAIHYFYSNDENSRYNFLFALGFLSYFIIQVFVNMGMNMGIMPITGITLPLISYGGSSFLTWVIGLALLP